MSFNCKIFRYKKHNNKPRKPQRLRGFIFLGGINLDQIRVVAYARVSSKEQAKKELSIPAQLKAIRKYCQDKNYKLVSEYLDEGKSAKTAERPAFQKMIALAKKQNRHFEAIIVHKFDRFSRSREDHVVYKALLKKVGVHVYSVTEQTDSETPHGFLLEGMLEVISEFYNMNLASETRKGMFKNARRGFHNGGSAPYGYRNHRFEQGGSIKSTWVLGPEPEVATIQRIFHFYAYEGMGYKKIAGLLNSESVPGPSGKPWSYTTIWHILHNEAYLGTRVWNKQDYGTPGKKYKPEDQWIRAQNAHPSIVSSEVFNLIKEKSSEKNTIYPGFRTGKSPFLLRGIFYCPNCGGRMVSSQSGSRKTGKKYVHRYYVCGNYQRKGKTVCKFKSFWKEPTEKAVIDTVLRELLILCLPGALEEAIKRYQEESQRDTINILNRLTSDIEVKTSHVRLLRENPQLMASPEISKHIEVLESEISLMRTRKAEIEATTLFTAPEQTTLNILRQNFKQHSEQLTWETPEIKGQLLQRYVDRVDSVNKETVLAITFQLTDPTQENIVLLTKTIAVEIKPLTE